MSAAAAAPPPGVLVVDKPAGPTSHDVVARLRRVLGTREVGHAGTLDPAATGVLLVAIGEGTKLTTWLGGHDKRYDATVRFGRATATLDAAGETTAVGDAPPSLALELAAVARGEAPSGSLARALDAERARTEQVPPGVSAIQIGGERAHAIVRRGETPLLAPRAISVRSIAVRGADPSSIELDVHTSKGFYVRALARDLGDALGVPAHLERLRRTASGPFTLADAAPLGADRDTWLARLVPLAEAASRALPVARLTDDGAVRTRHGKKLDAADFDLAPGVGPHAFVDRAGALVAVGQAEGDVFRVLRGFGQRTSTDST